MSEVRCRFEDVLIGFNKYFYFDEISNYISIDQITFGPVITIKSRINDNEYIYKINRIDIEDFNSGLDVKSIDDMINFMKSIIRDNKLDKIL